jgi:hypothetical protein
VTHEESGEGDRDTVGALKLDPSVARWTVDGLTFPLQRSVVGWSAIGLASIVAVCALIALWADTTSLGQVDRMMIAGCGVFFAGMCMYATLVLVRDRPVLVADRDGVRQGSKTIEWGDLSNVRIAESDVGGLRLQHLEVCGGPGRSIRVGSRHLGCSTEVARVAIRQWAIENVDATLFGGVADPGRQQGSGFAVLHEVARLVGVEEPSELRRDSGEGVAPG